MYNRYAPREGFQPTEDAAPAQGGPSGGRARPPLQALLERLGLGKGAGGAGALPEQLDRGDILLLLILLYLLWEGDDTELLIALAILLLGL